ncbi:hypothetical protein LINPERHAP2_LOCUS28914 [Linum perenne]
MEDDASDLRASLKDALFQRKCLDLFDWRQRFSVAVGIARVERRIIGDGGSTIDLPLFSMEDEVPPPSSDVDRNDLVEARSGNPLPVLAPFQLAGPMEI